MSFGRTKIYSDAKEITAANVVEEEKEQNHFKAA